MSELEFVKKERNDALRAMWVARAKIRNARIRLGSMVISTGRGELDREPTEAEIDATVAEEG